MMPALHKRNLAYLFFFYLIPALVLGNPCPWQAPYLGGYLGGGFGNNHISTDAGSVTDTSFFTTAADIQAINAAGAWTKNPRTMIAGIQLGHDWVWEQIVYGIVFDYSTLPLSSSRTSNNIYPDNPDQFSLYTSMRTNWLFTLRGRLGYQTILYLPSFFYLTGGFTLTQLKVNNNFNDNSAFAGIGNSHTAQNKIGWTVGTGIEIIACNQLSVNFEYLYLRVPSVKTVGFISNTEGGFGIPTQSMTSQLATSANFHANIFKIGLNYRLNE